MPSAIIRGHCEGTPIATPAALRRYDLPQSSADDTWTMLGPVPHAHRNRAVLMGHVTPDSAVTELVSVDLRGEQETVAELPADAEVIMSGTTYGQLG